MLHYFIMLGMGRSCPWHTWVRTGFDWIARAQTIHAFETYVSDGIAELEDMLANETKSNTEEVALAA